MSRFYRTVTEVKKVDKVEPVASTSTSQMEIPLKVVLETLEQDTMHPSWYNALKDEFTKPYFAQVGLNDLPRTRTQSLYLSTAEEVPNGRISFQHCLPHVYAPTPCLHLSLSIIDVPSPYSGKRILLVSLYPTEQRQSRDHRPRPIPRREPSPRALLLRPPSNEATRVSANHL